MGAPTPAEVSYWQTHQYDNRIPAIIVADVLCFSGASVAVILRFISRSIMKSALKMDDWIIVVGLVRTLESYCVWRLTTSLVSLGGCGSRTIGSYTRWIRTPRKLHYGYRIL